MDNKSKWTQSMELFQNDIKATYVDFVVKHY